MNRKKLFKKYSKHPKHTYELSETMSLTDETGRTPNIAFIYSGRDRGKSFEICTQCLADAWFDDKQLAYIRRYEDTQQMIQDYFADKEPFIKDMTDGISDRIVISKSILYFAHYDQDENKMIHDKELGRFFALSREGRYRSLQYPKIKNLLFEEVLTGGSWLQGESELLFNLYSTITRSDPEAKMYLISNLVTSVNPYSNGWGIHFDRTKPGEITLTKLYLEAYDEDGNERYFLIASHYLKDRNQLSKEDLSKTANRNRIRTGIASNKWDEAKLYPVMDLKFIKQYDIQETVVFEYDDMMFQMDILEVPQNIRQLYLDQEEEVKPSTNVMYIGYIRRKTTEPWENTRLYTNNPDRLSPYSTKGFKLIYKIDKVVQYLRETGWIVGCNNLTMNNFDTVFAKLKTTR